MLQLVIRNVLRINEVIGGLYSAIDIVKSILQIFSVIDGQKLLLDHFQYIFLELIVNFLEKAPQLRSNLLL